MIEYERGSEEFGRFANFSDAVFAIAMTLLVVGIGIPQVKEADLGNALGDLLPDIAAFFISFVIIGKYWLAHHRFISLLRVVTIRLMTINLVYLAAIAFVPFPTGLVSRYEGVALTVVIYALTLGAASLLETLMFAEARRSGLLQNPISDELFRYGLIASLIPVAVFVLSMPIALVDTTLALTSWILVFPAEWVLNRRGPAGSERVAG